MSDQDFDAISRITAKKRTQPRNTSLVQIAVEPTYHENQNEQVSSGLLEDKNDYKKSHNSEPLPEISAGMLRIETQINAAIQSICTQKKFSRDTFVEAAWLVLSENSEILNEVVSMAQERYNKRKARGNAKRAESMEKYKL